MHGFLSNLTAAVLALHTVLGCCWHHAHYCTETCATTQSTVTSPGCHDDHATSPQCDDHGDHGPRECRGSACVFVAAPKADLHRLTVHVDPLPAATLLGGGPSLGDVVGRRLLDRPDALLPPLRLHLLCQVLLI